MLRESKYLLFIEVSFTQVCHIDAGPDLAMIEFHSNFRVYSSLFGYIHMVILMHV